MAEQEIVTKHGRFVIRYHEAQNRWSAYDPNDKDHSSVLMSSETLATLRVRLDRYEKEREAFTRVPVVSLPGWDTKVFEHGEITSLIEPSGMMEKTQAWVSWGKKRREKVWDARTLILDNERNAPVLKELEVLYEQRRTLEDQRERLIKKLACYSPPKRKDES